MGHVAYVYFSQHLLAWHSSCRDTFLMYDFGGDVCCGTKRDITWSCCPNHQLKNHQPGEKTLPRAYDCSVGHHPNWQVLKAVGVHHLQEMLRSSTQIN